MTLREKLETALRKRAYQKELEIWQNARSLLYKITHRAPRDPRPGQSYGNLIRQFCKEYAHSKNFGKVMDPDDNHSFIGTVVTYHGGGTMPMVVITLYMDGQHYQEYYGFHSDGVVDRLEVPYPYSEITVDGMPERFPDYAKAPYRKAKDAVNELSSMISEIHRMLQKD